MRRLTESANKRAAHSFNAHAIDLHNSVPHVDPPRRLGRPTLHEPTNEMMRTSVAPKLDAHPL